MPLIFPTVSRGFCTTTVLCPLIKTASASVNDGQPIPLLYRTPRGNDSHLKPRNPTAQRTNRLSEAYIDGSTSSVQPPYLFCSAFTSLRPMR